MKQIFEPVYLHNMTVKNRLIRSATWESLASPEGFLNDEIYAIYEELARGGVGTIVTGLTDVSPYNWTLVGNMRLCSDTLIPDYKHLTELVHQYDCRIMPEINMDVYMRPERHIVPVAIDDMTENDMEDVKDLFVAASNRAFCAGFDGVQLHLAYQWFLSRLIDPMYNHRTDMYGGCTENRVRLIAEIINEIRAKEPSLHISAKFSFFDDENGDFNLDECIRVCVALEKAGIDSLEILGAHKAREMGTNMEGCYLDLGKSVKEAIHTPIILTGNNHDISHMEKMVAEDDMDLIGISRPLIREEDLPTRWENGSKEKAKCISCGRCYTTHGKRCIFNVKR